MMGEVQLNQFTFFRSYADCARYLPEQEQLAFFWALFDYGLDGTAPEHLDGAAMAVFIAVQPNIASSRNKAIVKLKSNPEQTENKPEQGGNKLEQIENEKEKEKEKEKTNYKKSSPKMKEVQGNWQ